MSAEEQYDLALFLLALLDDPIRSHNFAYVTHSLIWTRAQTATYMHNTCTFTEIIICFKENE